MRDIQPFTVSHYQNQEEFNILLNTAQQPKPHYSSIEQQPLLSLPHKASQVSRMTFLSYLIEILGTQFTIATILFICDPLTDVHISLIYETLLNPLSDTLLEFLNGVFPELQPFDRTGAFS